MFIDQCNCEIHDPRSRMDQLPESFPVCGNLPSKRFIIAMANLNSFSDVAINTRNEAASDVHARSGGECDAQWSDCCTDARTANALLNEETMPIVLARHRPEECRWFVPRPTLTIPANSRHSQGR
jgi:hypothetical protein